jgi:lysophospholipase L1-like esterase
MILTIFGIYKYINTEDHTEDMKKLEKELNQNQELIRQKQQEYLSKLKDEEDDWEKVLKELDGDKEKVKNVVRKLKVVGVGDSIMELAIKDLYKEFPNGYFDAVTNRTEDNALEVLKDLKSRNLLGDIVILNIGTNGGCHHNCRDEIMKLLGNRKVYWLNATHPDYDDFNPNLIALAKKYKNIKIVDWVSVAKKHPEYIISDKVHPTVYGCKVYAETIFKAIYNDYLTDFNKIKNEKIKEHEEQQKKKITFIGNDMLIKISSEIVNNYKTANLITSEEFTYEDIIDTLKEKINDKTLSYNIVFMFDKNIKLTDEEYNEIIKLCKNHKIYIIDINRDIHIDDKNVTVIDFYNEISNSYMSYDKIHLSDKGYERLKELIKKNIVI